ncbi:nucleotide sugar dehydrogenase [Roseobacter sp. YSTF-M11]|uniref:Nucleotide sugar dehydrogenase n=1 Tax=Roseobacter insulae TaxID=2859783 RepID=A0A9X1K0P1_9RHOB|nr:nucleotide sugar dehydrogenase [Roseobacter insulae]MBW4710761.1 nucleotide sugar dehydrogenase [Roseobacter insulae]
MLALKDAKIAVIGLGYVGLPLAVAFGARYPVVGFDISETRIAALKKGKDTTLETDTAELAGARQLSFSADPEDLAACNVYIVTVPTPVDAMKRPDLGPLIAASETVGQVIGAGDVVIYESTVYPGATEEDCIPIVERRSGLTFNRDFTAGYSPERINPGDKAHRLADIKKVTSGSTPEAAAFIDALYGSIITAGTHLAPSIRVAEAAKVIENTQRDVNIALINELAMIFDRMGLDTLDVLAAAGTKWNFQPFRPGLVGGHCIGVDPYYLTHKAQMLGYDPQMVLAGRRINDRMGAWMATSLVRAMIDREMQIKGARVLVLGLTFKEDVPDLRNTRVVDIVTELQDYGVQVDVHDPMVEPAEARKELGLETIQPDPGTYDAVVVAVPHRQIRAGGLEAILPLMAAEPLVLDVKGILPRREFILRV